MSQTLVLTSDEILEFAKKIYAEACCGYLDLCDSVAEQMTAELVGNKANSPAEKNSYFLNSTSGSWVWDNGPDLSINDPSLVGNIVVDPPVARTENNPVRPEVLFYG